MRATTEPGPGGIAQFPCRPQDSSFWPLSPKAACLLARRQRSRGRRGSWSDILLLDF